MKSALYTGWHKGESLRLFPNIEIDNFTDAFFISFTWLKFIFSIGLEGE